MIPAKEGVNAVYGDAPLGLYVVRGDSIVLLGEVDEQREAPSGSKLERVDTETIMEALAEAEEADEGVAEREKRKWDFDRIDRP